MTTASYLLPRVGLEDEARVPQAALHFGPQPLREVHRVRNPDHLSAQRRPGQQERAAWGELQGQRGVGGGGQESGEAGGAGVAKVG